MEVIESMNYPIMVGEESIRFLPEMIVKAMPSQIVFLYDKHSQEFAAPLINKLLYSARYLPTFDKDKIFTITISCGEKNKTLTTAEYIWQQLLQHQIDRQAMMVCVGGGVVGDIGNFAASVWKRGIHCILIPTTLLSMIDASCGGKSGIDFENYKNLLGLFSSPEAVICDPIFLQTLPQREWRSGFAEMLKHAIIAHNISAFENIKTIDYKTIVPLISTSISIKNKIILQDWKEENQRKMLNFGHTFGHALERAALSSTHPLLHGEAIALGMLAETYIAYRLGEVDLAFFETLQNIILRFYSDCKRSIYHHEILHNMLNDKKNQFGKIILSLPFAEKFISLEAIKDQALIFEALQVIE
ncbi:MAG: 3-dehydroquinate synthase [Bacteroidales bacterium]|nr:3-dehydroquinate synthase [Bacteroidales bacterium]